MDAETAQKILRPVEYEKGFHFFMPDGHYTGETALSLCAFLKDVANTDVESIRFHADRGDFQKWIQSTLGDPELASILDGLAKFPDEMLKPALIRIVQKRVSQLQLVGANDSESTSQLK